MKDTRTPAEIMRDSAEKIIEQMTDKHDVAASWLVKYGHGEKAQSLRADFENKYKEKFTYNADRIAFQI